MNNSNNLRCDFRLKDASFLMGYVGIPFSCCALCQNILTLLTIWYTQALHTNANIFFASVALNDAIMTLIWIFHEYLHFPEQNLDYSTIIIFDTLLLGVSYATALSSCTHMVIVAIDRYIHIAHPFYHMKNMTKMKLLKPLLGAWTIWLICIIIPLIAYRSDTYHKMCIAFKPPLEYFLLFVILLSVYYIIAFVCYFKISKMAFEHTKTNHARRLQFKNLENESRIKNNSTAAMRSVKFFTIMFGSFLICTLPQVILIGLKYTTIKIPTYVFCTILYLFELHSLMNFLIYVYMNKDFSKGLWHLFRLRGYN